MSDGNGRTHEPNLKEITAELDGLRSLLAERDRRYDERDLSNKEAVKSALAAAEKAAEKTEAALKEYKTAANEWRDTVKDLVSRMVTRPDVDREMKLLDARITEMRERQDRGAGKSEGISALWGVMLGGAALVSLLVAITALVWNVTRTSAASSQTPVPAQIIMVPAAPGTLIAAPQATQPAAAPNR